MTPPLRGGSLFTGTAGLDMAAAEVFPGLEPVWYADVKPAAVALLAHRLPGVPNLGDITAVGWSSTPPVDALTFGWPCQPFSSAGKRRGENDHRALFPEVIRCVRALRPRILLGENVARAASVGELQRAVREIASLGYVGAWRCITAADVGAPHKRDRLALVAIRADAAPDAIRRGLARHPQRDVGPLAGDEAPYGLDVVRRDPRGTDRLTLLPTPKASDGAKGSPNSRSRRGDLTLPSAAALIDRRAWGAALPTAAGLIDGRRWGPYAAAVERWERVLGRPAPCPTVTSARTGRPQLSPVFVEWMMGLPDGWVTAAPGLTPRPAGERAAMLNLLGDGVVPAQLAHGYRLALADLAATWIAA